MRHEKVIKDERGTVRIEVGLWIASVFHTDREGRAFRYDVTVWHKEPKKRSEVLSATIATPAEILETKLELWNLIKPC